MDDVVQSYHNGFNKAIHNYSRILRLFSESKDQVCLQSWLSHRTVLQQAAASERHSIFSTPHLHCTLLHRCAGA